MENERIKGKPEEGQGKLLFTDRELLLLIIPLLIELTLKLVVGMIDTMMVSSVGEAAVSGVSLVDSVMQLIIYILAAMASGGAVVAGQYLGSGNRSKARGASGELIWLNGLLVLAITAIVFLVSGWITGRLFGEIEADVSQYAKDYLLVVASSIPAIAVFEAGTAIFRTMGNAKVTMKISLIMNIINCIGNSIFIYGLSMGTRGAAISTVIARWFSAVVIIVLLLDNRRELCIARTWKHRFNREMARKILRIGVPNGVENGIFQIGKIALIGLAATFGTSAITANAVTQTLAAIENIPGGAMQLAVVPIIARCIGAGDCKQARYFNRKLLRITYIAEMATGFVMVLLLSPVLSIYRLSAETAALASSMFLWHTLGAVLLWPAAFILPASLRAAGDVKFPMLISVFSMWVFRFGGAYLLAELLGMGAVGIWISMSVMDWSFRAVIYFCLWRGGRWKSKRVV